LGFSENHFGADRMVEASDLAARDLTFQMSIKADGIDEPVRILVPPVIGNPPFIDRLNDQLVATLGQAPYSNHNLDVLRFVWEESSPGSGVGFVRLVVPQLVDVESITLEEVDILGFPLNTENVLGMQGFQPITVQLLQ